MNTVLSQAITAFLAENIAVIMLILLIVLPWVAWKTAWKVGGWKNGVEQELRLLSKKIDGLQAFLSSKFGDSLVKSLNPLALNERGQQIAQTIDAASLADRYAARLQPKASGMNAWQIQKLCFDFARDHVSIRHNLTLRLLWLFATLALTALSPTNAAAQAERLDFGTRTFTFTVTALADADIAENTTYTSATPATTGDTPIGKVTWTLGGDDIALLTIDADTGIVTLSPRDFEMPTDAGNDNGYEFTLTATDEDNNTHTSDVTTITVTDEVFTITGYKARASVAENTEYSSGAAPGTAGDATVGTVTWTLDGTDADDFSIVADTGVVTLPARDYEMPTDSNTNNIYQVTVIATDSASIAAQTARRTLTITVTDVDDTAPVLSNVTADTTNEFGFGDAARTVTFDILPVGATFTATSANAAASANNAFTTTKVLDTGAARSFTVTPPTAADDGVGPYTDTITITAISGADTATHMLTFTLTPVPIVLTGLASSVTTPFDFGGQTQSLPFTISPPDATYEFVFSIVPGSLVTAEVSGTGANRMLDITPVDTDPDTGAYTDTVAFTVSADGGANVNSNTVTVTLNPPPSVALTGLPAAATETALTYSAAAITYALTVDPTNAEVAVSTTGGGVTAEVAAVPGTAGEHTLTITPPSTGTNLDNTVVTVTATDPDSVLAAFTQTITFTVAPRAAAVFTGLDAAGITDAFDFGNDARTIQFTVSPATVPVTISPTTSALFTTSWALTDNTGGSYTLTIQPPATEPGTPGTYSETVTITASEDGRADATNELTFTINPAPLVLTGLPDTAATAFEFSGTNRVQTFDFTVAPANATVTFTAVAASSTVTAAVADAASGIAGEYTLTVTATADDGSGPYSDTVTVTASSAGRADVMHDLAVTLTPSAAGLILTPTAVTLDEGSNTFTYTVVLDTQPSAGVTVEITGHDGTDVTPDNTSLTFTISDWNTAQTVTLTAATDTDTADDFVTLRHTAGGGDYTGVTADLSVTVTDNDTPPMFSVADRAGFAEQTYPYAADTDFVTLTLPAAILGGVGNFSYTLEPLPTGLSFDPATRILSGTPTTVDTHVLTYTVTDSATPPQTTPPLTFNVMVVKRETVPAATDTPLTRPGVPSTGASATTILVNLPAKKSVSVGVPLPSVAEAQTPGNIDFSLTVDIALDTELDANTQATVCLPIASATGRALYHYRSKGMGVGTWKEIGRDTATRPGYVCGQTRTFSPFAVGPEVSRDANLIELSVATTGDSPIDIALNPTFDAAATFYAATAPVGTTSVTVAVTKNDDGANFEIAGTAADNSDELDVTSTGTGTTVSDLTIGANTITITVTAENNSDMQLYTITLTVPATGTDATARLNEQILSRVSQAITAGTLAAVSARVDAAARFDNAGISGNSVTPTLAYQLGGQSSMRDLMQAHGKSMLEGEMDYARLLEGASFVIPLSAAGDQSAGNLVGSLSAWGGMDYRNLGSDADGLDWDGGVSSVHFGIDGLVGEKVLAGIALSGHHADFNYKDTADSGEYQYHSANINPYVGWFPNKEVKVWASVGFGSGEVVIEADGSDARSTDTTQSSFAGGFSAQLLRDNSLLPGGTTTLHVKGDVAMSNVKVERAEEFMQQEVDSNRTRLLLSGEQQRKLASGGAMTPSLEIGGRSDGGDGVTGTGVELGGGLRYANPGGNLIVSGNVRTLLAHEYDEWGADVNVRMLPASGHGLSLSVNPVWGKTQSVTERLWDDGANEVVGESGDGELQSSLAAEVSYGVAATMLGSPGLLTPYVGMTADEVGIGRVRLGGRFAGGNGLSLDLEGAQRNTGDGVSRTVLLRGELTF